MFLTVRWRMQSGDPLIPMQAVRKPASPDERQGPESHDSGPQHRVGCYYFWAAFQAFA